MKVYKRDCEVEGNKAHEVIFRKGGNKFEAYVSFPDIRNKFGKFQKKFFDSKENSDGPFSQVGSCSLTRNMPSMMQMSL